MWCIIIVRLMVFFLSVQGLVVSGKFCALKKMCDFKDLDVLELLCGFVLM